MKCSSDSRASILFAQTVIDCLTAVVRRFPLFSSLQLFNANGKQLPTTADNCRQLPTTADKSGL
jgi:hypothetical protein